MNFVYAAMSFAICLMLIVFMAKENKAFYFFGFVFLFMGTWWLCDELTDLNFFQGNLLLIFRIVMAAALIVAIAIYFKEKKLRALKDENKKDS